MCGAAAIAKCGEKVVWHWAHAGQRHCDPWWENETEWHRSWKQCFPEEQREIVMFAPDGEKHIADVRTPNGMVVEFQNSPMAPEELRSREQFYGKMLWVVNAAPFRAQFSIMSPVPDPRSALGKDLVFSGGQRPIPHLKPSPTAGLGFWRRSENPNAGALVRHRSGRDIEDEIRGSYNGHHLFHWLRPKEVWLAATAPVFFDFGDSALWWLQRYDPEFNVRTVRRVLKADLIARNGGNAKALPPPLGESPLHPQVAPDELQKWWHA